MFKSSIGRILRKVPIPDKSNFQVSAASTFAQFGAPGNAAYCASKAAVIQLTRTAAKEHSNIRVNAVAPGKQSTHNSISTRLSDNFTHNFYLLNLISAYIERN
jgi:NAD(P)-dependent dehydrogenase (short-subunit alcohol dehydrogenase family)